MNYKTRFIFLFFLIGIFSCKQKENKSKQVQKQEVVVKDLNYYLENDLRGLDNNTGVEQKFNNEVYLRSFAFYEKEKNHYDLILELQEDISEDVVSKYTFAVEGFVEGKELEKLSDYAKKKNRTHDAWYGTPELIKINDHCYVVIDVKTNLKNFELLKFYLFDREGYKGERGERIVVYYYNID